MRLWTLICRVVAIPVMLTVGVSSAQAVTIGNTSLPSGAKMPKCTGGTGDLVQTSTDSKYSYVVPAGGGQITAWSVNAAGATAGTPYTLLVVRPVGGNSYTVIGTDTEDVPSGVTVASFTLRTPIAVQAGDVVGAAVTAQSTVGCLISGGTLSSSDVVARASTTAAVGGTLATSFPAQDSLANVAATVTQANDLGISQRAEPTSITQGDDAVFVLSITSTGPSSTPVTITDTLSANLKFVSVSAGTGTCTSSGQTVKCSLPGAPASVALVAQPSAAGTYTNTASVAGTVTDPNSANNSSTAQVTEHTAAAAIVDASARAVDVTTDLLALGHSPSRPTV